MAQGIPNKKTDLWEHYKENEEGCWEWTLSLIGGYGQFSLNNWNYQAHRIAYELHTGKEIPEGMCVCHTCDNPKCINPEHLFLGTSQDNIKDKMTKNRQAKGEKVNTSKLTESNIIEIKEKYSKGKNQTELGNEYMVSQAQISSILRGESWSHVSGKCQTRRSKLSEEQAMEIYENKKEMPIIYYTKRYNVSSNLVTKIRVGDVWSGVTRKSTLSFEERKNNHHKGEKMVRGKSIAEFKKEMEK